jgi:hypothetical protein
VIRKQCPECKDHHPGPAPQGPVTTAVQGDELAYEVTGVPGRPAHSSVMATLRVRHPGGGYLLRFHAASDGPQRGFAIVVEEG